MNVLFFLTPKEDVALVEEDDSLRQAIEKMEYYGFTAVPLITREGKYLGTITEGDLLRHLHRESFPSLKYLEKTSVKSVIRKRDNKPVNVSTDMEEVVKRAMNQNFVPVIDDDSVFIGIVTRKDLICYLANQSRQIKVSAAE